MKAFINLLITTDDYDDPERLEDAILAILEEEMIKVIWSKSKGAEDK